MKLPFRVLSEVELRGKTCLVRVDFNSPIVDGKIGDDSRIRMHSETLNYMSERGAKIVVLAHQGRPGSDDFTDLSMHAEALKQYVSSPVSFVDDIIGKKAESAIRGLNEGDILVLDNIRKHPDELLKKTPEELAKTELVERLSALADLYVNDAFAAAHRAQTSLVGFPQVMPSVAGLVMEREVRALTRVQRGERPLALLLGGTKIDDSLDVAKFFIEKGQADFIMPGGLLSTVVIAARGLDVGEINMAVLEKFKVKHLISIATELLKGSNAWVDIIDVALDVDGRRVEVPATDPKITKYQIKDIGTRTAKAFVEAVNKAKTTFINGPMGVYEDEEFRIGTQKVFSGIAESSTFSVAGGGHTLAALALLDLTERFSFVSSGGGALIEFIKGKPLPAIEALAEAKNNE